jgi:hypothetical protein
VEEKINKYNQNVINSKYEIFNWNDVKSICPNHTEIDGPSQKLFNRSSKITKVETIQKKSNEFINVK